MKIVWGSVMLLIGLLFIPSGSRGEAIIKLPPPVHQGKLSVEEALSLRRTVRHFANRALDLKQVSQLLWGADGLSDPRGLRTAPSAGATYPLDLYLVVGERGVGQLGPGLYHYRPGDHSLELASKGDLRAGVARAALHQTWMAEAPVIVVITGEYSRCTRRYGERGIMYTHMEAGNVGQNLFLQAEALGLGAGIVGAFVDYSMTQVLGLPKEHEPLLIMPVGYKH